MIDSSLNSTNKSPTISQVLSSFKKLHRTRQRVFAGHDEALTAARTKINDEYRKNIDCQDPDKVKDMVKFAEAVETELRCTVVQAVEVKEGTYGNYKSISHIQMIPTSSNDTIIPIPEATFRDDVQRLDNVPFNEMAILDVKPRKNRKCKPPE